MNYEINLDEKKKNYENTKLNDDIEIGSEVYISKRVLGRNIIHKYCEENRWSVKNRKGNEVENSQSNRKVVNRIDIKICELDQDRMRWSYNVNKTKRNIWSDRLRPRNC